MPDSNQDERPSSKLTTAIIGAVAACIILLAIAIGLYQQAEYRQEADERSAHYAKHAQAKISQTCVAVPAPEQSSCIQKATSEYHINKADNERNENDLVAQRTSALWTAIMGIAAVIGMGLSAVGVWLVKTTFDETRKGANAAVENLEVYRTAERAFLKAVGVRLFQTEGLVKYGFAVIFKNNGRSYAEIYKMSGFESDSIEWREDGHTHHSIKKIFIQPQEVADKDWGCFNEIKSPQGDVYMGVAHYKTLGGIGFKCYFCVVVHMDQSGQMFANLIPNVGVPDDT